MLQIVFKKIEWIKLLHKRIQSLALPTQCKDCTGCIKAGSFWQGYPVSVFKDSAPPTPTHKVTLKRNPVGCVSQRPSGDISVLQDQSLFKQQVCRLSLHRFVSQKTMLLNIL